MINPTSALAAEFWQHGRLADCPIIDMHAHMGGFYGGFIPNDTVESMLQTMDRCNTVLTCFVSHASLFAPHIGKKADFKTVLRFPQRLKAYHIVASNHLQVQDDLQRLRDYPDIYVGFKFLSDYYKVPLSDPQHTPYWQYADQNRLLVLAHTWGGSRFDGPEEVEKILASYPDLVLVAGHSINGDWESAVRLARKYPNIYLEMTAVLDKRGVLDYLVEQVGSERILFGVDLPWFSYYHGIGAVLSASISDDDRRNILYRNAHRLLSRFSWFEPLWQQAAPAAK